ncbi:MAG TPA: hypothetical protein VF328_14015 [Mycobacterium sp.]
MYRSVSIGVTTCRPIKGQIACSIAAIAAQRSLYNVGIDVLHFVWTVLSKVGVIGVKFPGDTDYTGEHLHPWHHQAIIRPGLTTSCPVGRAPGRRRY